MPTYYGIDPNNDPFKPKAQTTTQLASTAPLDPLNFTPDTRFFTPEQAKAVQTAQQTVKNYQSPSATTPVGDLFSGLYGTGSYQADPTQQAITDYYQTQANQVIDENKIRADKVAAIQAEVDAVNQLYARKLADVQLAGQNLTGQTNAIQARRGLAGSDFGTAQDQRVTAYNNEQNALVEAERNAKVQGLLSGARTDASAAIADARAQKEAAMQQYLSGLKTAQEDRKTRASEIALNALSLGVDLSTLTSAELKQLGKQYDIDPAQAVAQYQLALKDEQLFQAELDKARGTAETPDGFTLSSGQSRFDASGNLLASVAAQPKAIDPNTVIDNERALLGYFKSEPIVKNYNEVLNKKQSVDAIIDRGVGGPADLALVFEFMKALDPTSVVRESEYDTAAKSGNIFAGIYAQFNGYFRPEGGFLPPQVKEQFRNLTNQKLNIAQNQYDNLVQQYQGVAQRQGLNPENVLLNYSGATTNTPTNQTIYNDPASTPIGQILEIDGVRYKRTGENEFQEVSFNSVGGDTNIAAGQRVTIGGTTGVVTGYGSPLNADGLDVQLDGMKNANVTTPLSGTVVFAGDANDGLGNKVRIRLSDGRMLQMGHLDSINVKEGQTIAQGFSIGKQGNSGRTLGKTGIHVDYSLYDQQGTRLPIQEVIKALS